jgi:glutaredoxin-related protein
MSMLDHVRARAHGLLARVPGRVGERLRSVNEALGRPLADADELADRRAFAGRGAALHVPAVVVPADAEQAPVIVYYMDKQKRDVTKLTDILDANAIMYTVTNIQEDPAAQYAVKRDSDGQRLPVVFVAGDCVGGREALVNLASSGELKKKVFG